VSSIKSFIEFIAEGKKKKKEKKFEFGCIMVFFNLPAMDEIHELIDENDLYTEDGPRKYGLENEHHTTVLFGLHDEVDPDDVLDIANSVAKNHVSPIILKNASLFENERYDVLKFDADAEWLNLANKVISQLFPFTTDHPDYHPHCTIGYLKKGLGKKYVKLLKDKEFEVTPTHFVYSLPPDGEKIERKIEVKLDESKHISVPDLDKSQLKKAAKLIYNEIQASLGDGEFGGYAISNKRRHVLSFTSTGLFEDPRKIDVYLSMSDSKTSLSRSAHAIVKGDSASITYFGYWNAGKTVDEIYYSLIHEFVHSIDPKLYRDEVYPGVELKAKEIKNKMGRGKKHAAYLHYPYEFDAWTSAFCEQVLESFHKALMKIELDERVLNSAIDSLEACLKSGNPNMINNEFKAIVFDDYSDSKTWQTLFSSYFNSKNANHSFWKKFTQRVYNVISEIRSEIKIKSSL